MRLEVVELLAAVLAAAEVVHWLLTVQMFMGGAAMEGCLQSQTARQVLILLAILIGPGREPLLDHIGLQLV